MLGNIGMDFKKGFDNFIKKKLWRRKEAYQRVFLSDRGDLMPDAEIVLADLKRFCNAVKPSSRLDGQNKIDPYALAIGEGRREVWDRINAYIHLNEKTVQNLTEVD